MTTAILPPLLPDIDASRAAAILEQLEDEVRHCGALYGLLIDPAGQIVAADMPERRIPREQLAMLAIRLVPIFLTSRTLSRTFREWPIRATLEERGEICLVTQPILDQWLLAMAFSATVRAADSARLTQRWLLRLTPLIPEPAARRAARTPGRVITRDNVNLLFRQDRDDERDGDRDEDRGDEGHHAHEGEETWR